MTTKSKVNCSDLYAAEKLRRLDYDIDKTIHDLAKEVESRGVPKNKVARLVVKELTARGVLSPSRIYEGLGIEHKRKYRKIVKKGTFPQVENILKEESSTPRAVLLTGSSTGQSEILENMNGGQDTELVSEEQKQKEVPRQEDGKLEEKEEKSKLIRELVYLRGEKARLELHNEELKKQLAEKNEQISRLGKYVDNLRKENLPKLFQELQQMFDNDHLGLLDAKELQKISMEEGRDLETMIKPYNIVLKETAEMGQPVPLGTYIMTKPDMKLVPVRMIIDFNKKNVELSLWEKKLEGTV